MRTARSAYPSVAALVLFSCGAHADVVWNSSTHFLGAGVLELSVLDFYQGLGSLDRSAVVTEHNEQGVTTAKVNHESLTARSWAKSTTALALLSTQGSPGSDRSASTVTSSLSFSVRGPTRFELFYRTVDHSRTNNFFSMALTDESGLPVLQISDSRQIQGIESFTLSAGDYFLTEASSISGIGPGSFGRFSFTTSYALSVVPAPSPLAFLVTPALLLARRRRPGHRPSRRTSHRPSRRQD